MAAESKIAIIAAILGNVKRAIDEIEAAARAKHPGIHRIFIEASAVAGRRESP